MKIAHVCPFYTPIIGGVKQVVEELAKRQLKDGHEVHVFTSDWDKEKRIKKKEETIDGIKVHRCYHLFKAGNFVSFWPSLFFKLMKEDFDVIHTHVFGHPHVFFSALAGKLKGTALIHTTHCPWTDAYRSAIARLLLKLTYSTLSKYAIKQYDKIIAITPWELQFIEKYGGKGEATVIPNGMDKIFYKKIKLNDFKKKLKIKGKLVLFFGRLNPTKCPDNFVKVAKSILKERKNIDFLLIGPDEGMADKVKSMIKNEKRIKYLGPLRGREKVVKMYQAADIYVLPSYREGLPLTLFEAMASGLPIVASPVNGVPYEMKQPENGFLVKYYDINGYKERILKILDDKRLANKISRNNRERAKKYDWDIIYKKTMNLYKSAMDNT